MSDWRFHLLTLPDGEWIDRDLPLQEASITEALSAPASISGKLPLGYRMINDSSGKRALVEWGSAIVAEQDGRNPVFGIVDDLTTEGDWLMVGAGGFTSYPTGMPWIGAPFSSTGIDSLDVVRMIWSDLQAKKNGNLGVVVDTVKSGYILGKPEGHELTVAKERMAFQKKVMDKHNQEVLNIAETVKLWNDGVFAAMGRPTGGTIIRQSTEPKGDKRSKRNVWFEGPSNTELVDGQVWNGKKWVSVAYSKFLEAAQYYWNWLDQKAALTVAKSNLSMAKEKYNDAKSKVSDLSEQEAAPYQLNWWETQDLGSVISDLAEQTPFEYRESTEWDGDDNLSHRLRIGSPSIGINREDLRLEIGVNVTAPPPLTESDYASDVLVIGAGEGRSQIYSMANGNPGRLRRVAVVERKDFTRKVQVERAARSEIEARNAEWTFESLSLVDHPMCPYGSFEVGDKLYITGDAGWAQLAQWVRVIEITVDCTTGQLDLKVDSK